MPKTLDPFRLLLIAVAGWMNHERQKIIDYLREENRVLRAQIGWQRLRFDDQRRRLAVRAKALGMRLLSELATIVTPETLLRWHRRLIAEKYDGSANAAVGRPRTTRELAALVVRMATENRDWGYRRIQGALSNLGPTVVRGTIANILKKHAIDPAPERSRQTTWKDFLRQYWELIVAADSFTVEVWTRRGWQRFLVLFFIELSTRRVKIAGVAAQANGLWMSQIAPEISDPVDGLFLGKRYLIHDRDALFTAEFQRTQIPLYDSDSRTIASEFFGHYGNHHRRLPCARLLSTLPARGSGCNSPGLLSRAQASAFGGQVAPVNTQIPAAHRASMAPRPTFADSRKFLNAAIEKTLLLGIKTLHTDP